MNRRAFAGHRLWAITSYYNPVHYASRRRNYHVFRQHLGIPLLTVELAFDGRCELGADDADVLIQRTGGDVMWQKERLLNIALANLPAEAEFVAWLDCDVVMQRSDWAERTCKALEHAPLMQPHSRALNLPEGVALEHWDGRAELERISVAHLIAQGMAPGDCFNQSLNIRTTGFGWAARRELLDEHKFYDACILGGGDTAMACAAYGTFTALHDLYAVNKNVLPHYMPWAERFHAAVRGRVAALEGDLVHLWHGHRNDRHYRRRHRDLAAYDFDPVRDVAVGPDGCWRWNTPKHEMHDFVASYFAVRNEDGLRPPAAAA